MRKLYSCRTILQLSVVLSFLAPGFVMASSLSCESVFTSTEALRVSLKKQFRVYLTSRDASHILGVVRNADDDTIKKAYRLRAMETHPDRNQNDEIATVAFQRIKLAYETMLKGSWQMPDEPTTVFENDQENEEVQVTSTSSRGRVGDSDLAAEALKEAMANFLYNPSRPRFVEIPWRYTRGHVSEWYLRQPEVASAVVQVKEVPGLWSTSPKEKAAVISLNRFTENFAKQIQNNFQLQAFDMVLSKNNFFGRSEISDETGAEHAGLNIADFTSRFTAALSIESAEDLEYFKIINEKLYVGKLVQKAPTSSYISSSTHEYTTNLSQILRLFAARPEYRETLSLILQSGIRQKMDYEIDPAKFENKYATAAWHNIRVFRNQEFTDSIDYKDVSNKAQLDSILKILSNRFISPAEVRSQIMETIEKLKSKPAEVAPVTPEKPATDTAAEAKKKAGIFKFFSF